MALDRRDGRLLWHSPRQPSDNDPAADVCLGIAGDGLFVAGRNVVRRYHLPSGRLVWDTPTGDSHGRGLLTAAALYVPVGSAILRLDLETGAELSRSELISASREPVGNLATDGERLLCLSGARLSALLALDRHLERLARRIEQDDLAAQLERMQLRQRLGELDGAIVDLSAACALIEAQQGRNAAARLLLNGLVELNLAERRPETVLRLLAESEALREDVARESGTAAPAANRNESSWKLSQLLHAALLRIARSAGDGERSPPETDTPGLVPAILDAAPLYRPAYLQMAARSAMAAAATAADRDRLQRALTAEDPAVRSLGLAGIAAVLEDDALPLIQAALDDTDESVRFQAAVALVNRGGREALPVLADLLDSPDLEMRGRSVATLRAVTGQHFEFVASATAEERAAKAAEWRAWIGERGFSAELRLPVREAGIALGRTLIAYTNNRLIELDDSGRAVWQQEVANPWGCQGLPNGHRLVASYSGRAVYEYNADGRLVWEKDELPSSPQSVERLDNGNTLVCCYAANKVLEIAPDGSIVQEIDLPDHPRDARRLDNGQTLVALYSSGRVVEVNPLGEILWEVGGMNRPVAVQRLDNGHTLVCQYSGKQVVEVDRGGNTVWFKSGLEYPSDAQRLPTGNTLIVDRNGVQEVDPAGSVVREYPGSGATSVWRY
jgi:outer membrane protein assembly factor BamB